MSNVVTMLSTICQELEATVWICVSSRGGADVLVLATEVIVGKPILDYATT